MLNNYFIPEEFEAYKRSRCSDSGCRLNIGRGISSIDIIDIEQYWIDSKKVGKIGDHIIFCIYDDTNHTAVIELKNKSIKVSAIQEKLQNCSNTIEEITLKYDWDNSEHYPILCCKAINPMKRVALSKKSIDFNRKSKPIFVKKCGESLVDAF